MVFLGFSSLRCLFARPAMSVLLFDCRPSDVARFIALVIVDTINRMIRGGWITDCFVESGKVIYPLRANGDAAASVVRISRICGGKASVFHGAPDVMDACASKTVLYPDNALFAKLGQSLLPSFMKGLFVKATAGVGVSSSKVAGFRPSCVSAVALAFPMDPHSLATSFSWSNYSEFTESLSN